jgi:hypothetical protein
MVRFKSLEIAEWRKVCARCLAFFSFKSYYNKALRNEVAPFCISRQFAQTGG